jgi:ATP/maltotriose-dependent transcriptional regulator MalT
VLLFLALVVFLLFAGLGFFAHVMWLGLVAAFLLLVGHMVRQGLARGTPTSRLNVRLLSALRGYLDDVLTTKTRERELREQLDTVPELEAAPATAETDEVAEAEIVEDEDVPATKAAAAQVRRPEVRASVKDRAAQWRAMTPAKLATAEQMAGEGASNAEIARKLNVSRSTVSRHLAGKVG